MNEISQIIKKIATEGHKIQTCPAKVININRIEEESVGQDESLFVAYAYTVDVIRPDGAEIYNVRLKASIQDKEQGVICIPQLNSWVLISIIETTETRAFISQYSEIDKIFLRIKKSENQYFQMNLDGASTELLFKEKEEANTGTAGASSSFKDVARLGFGNDKTFKLQYLDDAGENTVQETTIAHDKVIIDFEDGAGYQAEMDTTKFRFSKGNLDFELTDNERLKVTGEEGLSLKDQLDSLINEISKIVVVQGTSPNIGNLTTIKGNIAKILE